MTYCWDRSLSNGDKASIHIAMFSFSEHASAKSAPEMLVTMKLVEQVVLDGFITLMDELKITMPHALLQDALPSPTSPPGTLGAQTIGYIKGQARMNMLLCLLSLVLDDGVDLVQVHPILYETIRSAH